MGGERMTEGVWADIFGQPDGISQFFYEVENHDTGEVFASSADKYIVFVPFLDVG